MPSTIVIFSFILVSTGCTTMPTTVGFNEEDDEYVSDAVIEMVVATKTDAEIDDAEVETKTEEVVEHRETYHSSRGYWQAAINYLQAGNEDDARWALEKALILNPKSKIAKTLLYQLDVDAINELGSTYFEYKVQYGDSLSKLSKLYLDDALKFYLLAKYNEIENPERLVVGQVIQIPGHNKPYDISTVTNISTKTVITGDSVSVNENNINTRTNDSNNEASTTQQSSLELLNDAREMFSAGEYVATIDVIENNNSEIDSNADIKQVLVKAYYMEAKKLLVKKDLVESRLLLTRAIELEPDNVEVNMMLIDMNELDQADLLFKKSLKALAMNDPVKAYALINQVLGVQPGNKKALEKKQEISKLLSEYYYKQALMAQRKHELDTAIEYWDEVLALDRNNDNAKLYRAKAVNLKIKLERFVSTQ